MLSIERSIGIIFLRLIAQIVVRISLTTHIIKIFFNRKQHGMFFFYEESSCIEHLKRNKIVASLIEEWHKQKAENQWQMKNWMNRVNLITILWTWIFARVLILVRMTALKTKRNKKKIIYWNLESWMHLRIQVRYLKYIVWLSHLNILYRLYVWKVDSLHAVATFFFIGVCLCVF